MPGEFAGVDMVVDDALKDYTDGALRMIPALKALYGDDAACVYPPGWHRVYRNRIPLVDHRYVPLSALSEVPDGATVILLTNMWFETRLPQSARVAWRQRERFSRLVFGVDDVNFQFSGDTRLLFDYLGHYDDYGRLFERIARRRWLQPDFASVRSQNLYLVEVSLFLRAMGVRTDGSLFGLLQAMSATPLHPLWGYFDICFGDLEQYPNRDDLRELWQPWLERQFVERLGSLDHVVDETDMLLREHTRWLSRHARLLSLPGGAIEAARGYLVQASPSKELRRDLSWLSF